MAKHKINWCEKKGDDWVVATLESGEANVSINRTSKKGEAFPNFDGIAPGAEVEGELWQSAAGKWYLFPPKPQASHGGPNRGNGGAYKAKMIEETMQKKEASIGRFQDSKEFSIKVSSTFRAAVDSALEEYRASANISLARPDVTALFRKWREFYWNEFDVIETDYPPKI